MKQTCASILFFLLSIFIIAGARASVQEFIYQDKGNRDPFISLVTDDGCILPGARTATETGNVELEGVIWDPDGKSMAIINGKLVKEKQRIMNMQVLKIKKASVILQKEGKVMVINLKQIGGDFNGQE